MLQYERPFAETAIKKQNADRRISCDILFLGYPYFASAKLTGLMKNYRKFYRLFNISILLVARIQEDSSQYFVQRTRMIRYDKFKRPKNPKKRTELLPQER